MDERRLELKVGALFAAAIAGVLALLWMMGELRLARGSELAVDFSHTGGVVKGAPVKVGGIAVGKVERMILYPERRDQDGSPLPVRMELSVERASMSALREDAAVVVATQGPLGEAYLELQVGSLQTAPLSPGRALRGNDSVRFELVAARLANFLQAAGRVLDEDPKALSTFVGGMTRLSGSVSEILTENRGEIHALSAELLAAAKDLRAVASLAHRHLEPGGKLNELVSDSAASARLMKHELPQLSSDAKGVLSGLHAIAGNFSAEDGQRIRQAISRYAKAGESLEQLATRGERILAQIEEGKGTLGGLQKDPQLYQDLKALVSDLRQHPWKVLWKN